MNEILVFIGIPLAVFIIGMLILRFIYTWHTPFYVKDIVEELVKLNQTMQEIKENQEKILNLHNENNNKTL